MNFGQAIEALKEGKKATRLGWNGKDMWLFLTPGSVLPLDTVKNTLLSDKELTELGLDSLTILPHIDMFTAQKTYLCGWLASQTDMLAEDWMII